MALLLRNNVIFFHVPKTAGTWVENVLYKSGLILARIGHKHETPSRIFNKSFHRLLQESSLCHPWNVKDRLDLANRLINLSPSMYSFIFVRSPLAWYESWFRYMSRCDRNWRRWGESAVAARNWHPCYPLNTIRHPENFDDFAKSVVASYPGWVTCLYAQYDFSEVDFVGTKENLLASIVDLSYIIDEPALRKVAEREVLQKVNEGTTEPLVWNRSTKQKVAEVEKTAILRYGYRTIE